MAKSEIKKKKSNVVFCFFISFGNKKTKQNKTKKQKTKNNQTIKQNKNKKNIYIKKPLVRLIHTQSTGMECIKLNTICSTYFNVKMDSKFKYKEAAC